jgi:hypothetical protein
MTEQDAQMLKNELERYYGHKVASVSEYCTKVLQYIDDAKEHLATCGINASDLKLAISKSSYLDRILYLDEKRRTKMCPEHKGHWSGIQFEQAACGCDLTGWLREE